MHQVDKPDAPLGLTDTERIGMAIRVMHDGSRLVSGRAGGKTAPKPGFGCPPVNQAQAVALISRAFSARSHADCQLFFAISAPLLGFGRLLPTRRDPCDRGGEIGATVRSSGPLVCPWRSGARMLPRPFSRWPPRCGPRNCWRSPSRGAWDSRTRRSGGPVHHNRVTAQRLIAHRLAVRR
jgi:hypothetical protein